MGSKIGTAYAVPVRGGEVSVLVNAAEEDALKAADTDGAAARQAIDKICSRVQAKMQSDARYTVKPHLIANRMAETLGQPALAALYGGRPRHPRHQPRRMKAGA